MTQATDSETSWRTGLQRAADALWGLLQCRLELFALELQEQKERLLWLLLRLAAVLALGACGLLLLLGLLAWLAYQLLGFWGVAAMAVLCLCAAGWSARSLLRALRSEPAPFHQTVAEFKKDRAWLAPAE